MIRPGGGRYKCRAGFRFLALWIRDGHSSRFEAVARTFTLDEAQTLLPVLSALLMRARESAERAAGFENDMAELSQRIFLSGGLHVDVAAAARRRAERDKAMTETRTNIAEIEEIGARVVQSDTGALEFPALADGRSVLLCWSAGDEQIERWREDEDGSPEKEIQDGLFSRERPN